MIIKVMTKSGQRRLDMEQINFYSPYPDGCNFHLKDGSTLETLNRMNERHKDNPSISDLESGKAREQTGYIKPVRFMNKTKKDT